MQDRPQTHFNAEHGGARWATDSERQRVLDRLQKADDERRDAKRLYVDAHRALVIYRSMKNLEKRAETEPDGLSKMQLQVLALRMGNKFKLHDLGPGHDACSMRGLVVREYSPSGASMVTGGPWLLCPVISRPSLRASAARRHRWMVSVGTYAEISQIDRALGEFAAL